MAYPAVRWAGGTVLVALMAVVVATILWEGTPALVHYGWRFLWSGVLSTSQGIWGAGPLIVGSLLSVVIALVLAVPVGVGTAAALAELTPRSLSAVLTPVVELLAAVPSVVVGLWGLFVLQPIFARHVDPFLEKVPLFDHIAHGPAYGPSVLLAGVVLAVMVLPTIVALSRSAMVGVQLPDREAAMALGATPWQVVCRAVVPGARSGIRAAVILAIGRALGEAIAVVLVIGSIPVVPHSLLAPAATLASAIVSHFGEATTTAQRSAVVALAIILLVLTALVNGAGQWLLRERRLDGDVVR